MLYTIMKHIHNFFPVERKTGKYTIESNTISLDFIQDGQYFLIEGSVFNDGVYKYPCDALHDEVFTGTVTALAPPAEFMTTVDDIEAYVEKADRAGFTSESFGGYSYTRATTSNGTLADWHDVFRQRLNTWRKA